MISTTEDLERLAQEVVARHAEHGGVQGALEIRGINWEALAKHAARAAASLEREEDSNKRAEALFVTAFEMGLQAGYRGDE